jgi:hypothetical protein
MAAVNRPILHQRLRKQYDYLHKWARDLYFNELRPKYKEDSKLVPSTKTAKVKNGRLKLAVTAAPNAVIFYKVEAIN